MAFAVSRFVYKNGPCGDWGTKENFYMKKLIFLLLIVNLVPIYPLDGGRILIGILHIIVGKQKADDAINNISMISTILITTIASVLILYLKNIAIFLIVMYLWYLVLKESNRYLRRKKYIMKILENKTNK